MGTRSDLLQRSCSQPAGARAETKQRNRRQETGDRRQEAGDRRQETGDGRRETGGGRLLEHVAVWDENAPAGGAGLLRGQDVGLSRGLRQKPLRRSLEVSSEAQTQM